MAIALRILRGEYLEKEQSGLSKVLTISEVAEILYLSGDTVKKLLNSGRLKGVRTGGYSGKWRISESALEEFLEGEARQAGPTR